MSRKVEHVERQGGVPAVSVIIPVFNDRERLDACLASLGSQAPEAPPFEVIVVDDGSSDRPEEVVARHPLARLLWQPNAGPAAARNRGALAARAPILAFVDADCVPSHDWVREITRPFEDPRVCGAQGRYITEQRSLVARFVQLEIEQRYDIMARHETIDMVGTYSAAFRRDVFLRHGGFDTSFPDASGEDMDFSFRLQEAGHRLVLAPGAVVAHHHPETAVGYFRQKFGRAYWRYLLYQKHPRKIVSDTYTPQGLKFQVAMLAAAALALVSSFFWTPGAYVSGVSVCLFNLVLLPFEFELFRKDRAVGLVAPWLLLGRAVSLLSGLAAAVVGVGRLREVEVVSVSRRPIPSRIGESLARVGAAAVSSPFASDIVIEASELRQHLGGRVLPLDAASVEVAHPGA